MIILEGCDGVGKTSTIELLKKSGICCSDRSKDVFSRYMVKEVSMKERARVYFEYLKSKVLILLFYSWSFLIDFMFNSINYKRRFL